MKTSRLFEEQQLILELSVPRVAEYLTEASGPNCSEEKGNTLSPLNRQSFSVALLFSEIHLR